MEIRTMSDEDNREVPEVTDLIQRIGLGSVLRAVSAYCKAEHRKRTDKYYRDSMLVIEDETGEYPEAVRRERDEAQAILFADPHGQAEEYERQMSRADQGRLPGGVSDRQAEEYERQMSRAGWTREQERKTARALQIAELETRIEKLKKGEADPNPYDWS